MWMVGGYNDSSHHHPHHSHHHHQAVNLDGRKLRPLIPRPPVILSSANCASSPTTHSCNFGLYTSSDLFSLNHHPGEGGEQGISEKNISKEEININNGGTNQAVVNTSRWNPTQEQLRTLEDLYRRGTRTPSTEQIQRITAELRRYGKIEGKNVFYWFQNHKARERQKRRRELEILSHHHQPHFDESYEPVITSKERGPANGKHGYETEQTRRPYSIIAEECGATSMQRAAAKGGRRVAAVSDDRHNTINTSSTVTTASACLFQLDDERNATWHALSSSSSSPSFCYSTAAPSVVTCVRTSPPPTHKTRRFMSSLKHPATNTISLRGEEGGCEEHDDEGEDSPTLQLFPLRRQDEEDDRDKSNDKDVRFFEFLPPKT